MAYKTGSYKIKFSSAGRVWLYLENSLAYDISNG